MSLELKIIGEAIASTWWGWTMFAYRTDLALTVIPLIAASAFALIFFIIIHLDDK